MNRDYPSTGDPDFVERMVRMSEEDTCQRVLIPYLSDTSLIKEYRRQQKDNSLDNDTHFLTLIHLEISVRLFEHLIAAEKAKKK